jgi:hypothetical protein
VVEEDGGRNGLNKINRRRGEELKVGAERKEWKE